MKKEKFYIFADKDGYVWKSKELEEVPFINSASIDDVIVLEYMYKDKFQKLTFSAKKVKKNKWRPNKNIDTVIDIYIQ